jgi:hypothetical protein
LRNEFPSEGKGKPCPLGVGYNPENPKIGGIGVQTRGIVYVVLFMTKE